MSNIDLARRTELQLSFDGINITADIQPYILSVTYTDNEEDEADDLQIKLQDRESIWLNKWIDKMIGAAASSKMEKSGLSIQAAFARKNWKGTGLDDVLDTGSLEFDTLDVSGPPNVITIKATSLPFSSQIRQTKKSRAWEAYTLSRIAKEMARKQGLGCMYLSTKDPYYARREQYQISDIKFLSKLCHEAGISLKVTGRMLVLFDQASFEAKKKVRTFEKGDGSYISFKFNTGKADTDYASCRVSYVDPATGRCIEGMATVEEYDPESEDNQQLEVTAAVASIGEAEKLAAKYLRLYNKYAKTVSFTLPGDPGMLSGLTIELKGFGAFDGRYIIKQSRHEASNAGYKTTITCRATLPYYEDPTQSAPGGGAKETYEVGDVVQFKGGYHYYTSYAAENSGYCAPGPATITATNPGAPHPWHLVHTDGQTHVWGWVDDGSFE